MFDALTARCGLVLSHDGVGLTAAGVRWFGAAGVDITEIPPGRRPAMRTCLDWTERRYHLAGSFAAALADAWLATGWVERRQPGERGLRITERGAAALGRLLDVAEGETPSA